MKIWQQFITTLMVMVSLGCAAKKPLDVLVLLRSDYQENAYYRLMAQGVQQQLALIAADNSPVNVVYLLAEDEDSALTDVLLDKQRQAWEDVLSGEPPAAVIFTPEDEHTLTPLLLAAREKGMKTVSLLGPVDGADASVALGLDAESPLKSITSGQSLTGSMIIAGGANIPQLNQMAESFNEQARVYAPQLKPLASNYNFGPVIWRSRAYTFNFLVLAPDLRLFIALEDHIGRANMSAIEERGRAGDIMVVSVGGSQELLEQAAQYPNFLGLLKVNPQQMGALAAQLAYSLVYRADKLKRTDIVVEVPLQQLTTATSWDAPFPAKGFSLPRKGQTAPAAP